MIADKLTVDGFDVRHIMTPDKEPVPHQPSPGLKVVDGLVTYPGDQPRLL